MALYLALDSLFSEKEQKKIYIIRSAVPTRDIGFLPGSLKEKVEIFETPYREICSELFDRDDAYEILKKKGMLEFATTSFFRGMTFRDSILILDEFQNTNFHEFSTIMTRVGDNTRVIVSGDVTQSDLKRHEASDSNLMVEVLKDMTEQFSTVHFDFNDIVRSEFVKSFLISKEKIINAKPKVEPVRYQV